MAGSDGGRDRPPNGGKQGGVDPEYGQFFRALMTKHGPAMRVYALSLTGAPDQAEDLLHDSFVRAMEKQEQWRGGGSFAAWFRTIIYSLWSHQRDSAYARRVESGVEVDEIEPDQVAVGGMPARAPATTEDRLAERDLILRAVAQLPPEQRAVVALVVVVGLSYAEVAEELDIAMGTVMSRASRGKAQLRKLLFEG